MTHSFNKQVFISGCQRSGTTLLGAILGSGEGCLVTPECQFKRSLLREGDWRIGREESLKRAMNILRNDFRFKIWGIELIEKEVLANSEIVSYETFLNFILREYQREHFGETKEASIWVDHDPASLSDQTAVSGSFSECEVCSYHPRPASSGSFGAGFRLGRGNRTRGRALLEKEDGKAIGR